jgi:hypothetical protein
MMLGAGFFCGECLPCFDFRNLVFTCIRVFLQFYDFASEERSHINKQQIFQSISTKKKTQIDHVSIIGSNRYGYVMKC